jgi:ubiquinone/menaquinone biosynthesis C-methylase UbiE
VKSYNEMVVYRFPQSDDESYQLLVQLVHSKFYDSYLRYAMFPFGGETKLRGALLEKISFVENENILDLCCGTGGSTFAIREKIGNHGVVTGMDLNSGRIVIAQNKNPYANVRFMTGDARSTGFHNEAFSKVFVCFALHEMPGHLRLDILQEVKRILCDKGTVIIFEEDVPRSLWRRVFLSVWNWNWVPSPLNLESNTKKDMIKKGVVHDTLDVGFSDIKKLEMFEGGMQIIIGRKTQE